MVVKVIVVMVTVVIVTVVIVLLVIVTVLTVVIVTVVIVTVVIVTAVIATVVIVTVVIVAVVKVTVVIVTVAIVTVVIVTVVKEEKRKYIYIYLLSQYFWTEQFDLFDNQRDALRAAFWHSRDVFGNFCQQVSPCPDTSLVWSKICTLMYKTVTTFSCN